MTPIRSTRAVRIGRKLIGDGNPCFIIAEAGSNHDGNFRQALKLIDVAAEAGADAVKFQNFHARTLYPRSNDRPRYLRSLGVTKTIYQIIKEMEMPSTWVPRLADYCRKRRILFLSTPFDEESVDLLAPYVPAFKIASYEMTHIPLIEHCLRTRKPVVISTGGADMDEIERVAAHLRDRPYALMQCTAKYPAPPESLNLRAIATLKRAFRVPVGFSDHSLHPLVAPLAALGFGSNLLEKHFTLSRRLKGPDHSYAIEPGELKSLVRAIRDAEMMAGSGVKVPHPVERELRDYRRGIFTVSRVAEGERFSGENISILRRAGKRETDLRPEHFPEVIGRTARRTLAARRLLSTADLAD